MTIAQPAGDATTASAPDTRLLTEVVPDQVLPKVLNTFDLVSVYVFIIFFVSGSAIIAGGGWASMSMWVLGIVLFLIPAGMAVIELGGLWPAQGGVYVWSYHTMGETAAFVGGFLSWIPVILGGLINPAAIVAYLTLAFGITLGLTANIICQLVVLWLTVAFALRKLRLTQTLANGVMIFYTVLVIGMLAAGIGLALDHGKSATSFHIGDAVTFDFGTYGWIFGVVLLYLLGVETPFNMGAEFITARSAPKMVWWGSIALSVGYVIATLGMLFGMPPDQLDPITGPAKLYGETGIPGLQAIAAIGIAVIIFTAYSIYNSAYSRLIFVSGLERHLPRLFTHLNPRTRNPVTALLIQGVICSVGIVGLYSQSSLTTVFLSLEGALTVLWLISGFFFLVPLIIARYKYAERYATGDFWRIPGGRPTAIIVAAIGIAGTAAGIYYTITLPWSEDITKGTWMTYIGVISAVTLALGALVYVFGRRAASKLSDDQRLAHLATLEAPA